MSNMRHLMRLGLFSGARYHPDTVAWLARVATASGTVSANDIAAIEVAAAGMRALSMGDSNTRWNPFVGNQLASALVPYWRGGGPDVDASVNFVSGDYTRNTGITGNGSSKYLNTGTRITTNTGIILFQSLTAMSTAGTNKWCIGVGNGTDNYIVGMGSTYYRSYFGGGVPLNSFPTQNTAGTYSVVRTASNTAYMYTDSSSPGVVAGAGTSLTPLELSVYVFAKNISGTAGEFAAAISSGGYLFSSISTLVAASAAQTAMINLKYALGR